jgi:hypothetical protein
LGMGDAQHPPRAKWLRRCRGQCNAGDRCAALPHKVRDGGKLGRRASMRRHSGSGSHYPPGDWGNVMLVIPVGGYGPA